VFVRRPKDSSIQVICLAGISQNVFLLFLLTSDPTGCYSLPRFHLLYTASRLGRARVDDLGTIQLFEPKFSCASCPNGDWKFFSCFSSQVLTTSFTFLAVSERIAFFFPLGGDLGIELQTDYIRLATIIKEISPKYIIRYDRYYSRILEMRDIC
jgi:hypothetical protein